MIAATCWQPQEQFRLLSWRREESFASSSRNCIPADAWRQYLAVPTTPEDPWHMLVLTARCMVMLAATCRQPQEQFRLLSWRRVEESPASSGRNCIPADAWRHDLAVPTTLEDPLHIVVLAACCMVMVAATDRQPQEQFRALSWSREESPASSGRNCIPADAWRHYLAVPTMPQHT